MEELSKTVKLMNSSNYDDRFRAEYRQLEIRIIELSTLLTKHKENALGTTELLEKQLKAMTLYRTCLQERAKIEKINTLGGFYNGKIFKNNY